MNPWTKRRAKAASDSEQVMRRARTLFGVEEFGAEESKDLRGVIAEKIEELRYYDVLAMDRVVAVLAWGRSGSLLLASYLDGHDDVLMLPELCSWRLYQFFEEHRSLPLRDKLIAYAALEPDYPRFFEGNFAISPDQYYAAVRAILAFYAGYPPEFLESRRTFFLFVHMAYNLALGRRPASRHPLLAFALHEWDDAGARFLVEDFPQAKFVHTIRDPISSSNAMFQFLFGGLDQHSPRTYILAPYSALCCLTDRDRPHSGMESRTRTVRFEDLHRDAAGAMRDLADWLGLPYQATLLDSTFNGLPYVVSREGNAWSGRRLEQAQRQSGNLSRRDRALLFAVFYENFADWNYPCPRIFANAPVRCIVFVSLLLMPMKMEMLAARAIFRRRIVPSLGRGNIVDAIRCVAGIVFCRLKIIWLLTPVFLRRYTHRAALLAVDPKAPPLEWRDDAARPATRETTVE
jgi:hypothetical protein